MTVDRIRRGFEHTAEHFSTPTDLDIVNRFQDAGISDYAVVPCSITATIHEEWEKRSQQGQLNLITAINEHSLPAIATGIHLGTGQVPAMHMQNSGLPNAGDGIISLISVYEIPSVAIVTWRGNDKKDDSEPHQEIGRRTPQLTRAIFEKNIFGNRRGHSILHEIDRSIDVAKGGGLSVLRLSPDAFVKPKKPTLPPEALVFDPEERAKMLAKYAETVVLKGTDSSPIPTDKRYSREDAIQAIAEIHPEAALLFCNGYTARVAQKTHNETRDFYNTGNMGGTLAIGWAMARSNPDIEVVVVDGDQNAEMNTIMANVAEDYPGNLFYYVLNNTIGASVGVARSVQLPPWYYELARVIPTHPDNPAEGFEYKRVNMFAGRKDDKIGAHFDTEETQEMARAIGPLPVHARRFMQWVQIQSERNRTGR